MSELNANIFRDYFGGSWSGRISKNGDFQREVVFNWAVAFDKFSALGPEEGLAAVPNVGVLDDTKQISVSGWRSDLRRWVNVWHNEFGGYGELHWTSMNEIEGTTVLYGFVHECKQETDDPTDHIVMCEMYNQDKFKYTINSFKKGLTEIIATRIRTRDELKEIMEKQTHVVSGFTELSLL